MSSLWQQIADALREEFSVLPEGGAAMFVFIPQQEAVFEDGSTRIFQGRVAGKGHLGAGSIIESGDEEQVEGLATAAGIGRTAAIRDAAGKERQFDGGSQHRAALGHPGGSPHVGRPVCIDNRKPDDSPTNGGVEDVAPARRVGQCVCKAFRPEF